MRPNCTVLVMLLSAAGLGADTYPRQPGIDVRHYVFRLSITDGSDQIAGEATIAIGLRQPGVAEVALDLASSANGTGMTVDGVRAGGAGDGDALGFTHAADRLRIALPPGLKSGDEVMLRVAYHGVPREGLRIGPNLHGDRTVFSDSWPDRARHWLPTVDHPSDKATSEFVVTAPAAYQVVSNGVLVEEVDLAGGLRRTHWRQSAPIASWLYALGVARFSVHHAGLAAGVPLQTWVYPEDAAAGRGLFEDLSRRAMAFFAERVGPYAYEKLAHVQAAGHSGGMELASSIFYGEKIVAEGRGPVVHEIAHQWFGNAVTERDWDDVWLSEGFATYFTLLFTEHDQGRDAFADALGRSRAQVLQIERKLPGTPVVHPNLADMRRVLNGLVYEKGGWVLHMLRAEVGTEVFWEAIREYYRRHRDGVASTAELREVFERASGRELGWFFAQWLTRAGVPRVEGTWRWDAGRKVVEVAIEQVQEGEPFRLALYVAVEGRSGGPARVERAVFEGRRATIAVAAGARPAAVRLDPDTWALVEVGSFAERK